MTVLRQTDEMFRQLRALFAAGRVAIRGPGAVLAFIREVDRETRELDRVMREHLAESARRQCDEMAAATFYGEGRPSEISNAAFGVDGAEADALAGGLLDTRAEAVEAAAEVLRQAGRFTISAPMNGPPMSFDAIMRAVRPPAEVAPDHAKKVGEPSPKLPTYRPT